MNDQLQEVMRDYRTEIEFFFYLHNEPMKSKTVGPRFMQNMYNCAQQCISYESMNDISYFKNQSMTSSESHVRGLRSGIGLHHW